MKNLKHLGGDHVYSTLKQHFYWKGVKDSAKSHNKNCETCQLRKMPKKNYGELPLKDSVLDVIPWKRPRVGTIGPWETSVTEDQKEKRGKRKKIKNKLVAVCAMTTIDEATSWLETVRIDDKTSHETSRVLIGSGCADARVQKRRFTAMERSSRRSSKALHSRVASKANLFQ